MSIFTRPPHYQSPLFACGTSQLVNAGDYDGFVAKLADGGTTASFTWARRIGGANLDNISTVAVNGSSVYIGGAFFGVGISFDTLTLTNAGRPETADAFVAKLTDTGSGADFVWAQRAGGTNNESANSIAVAGTNVYLVGPFTSTTAAFGSTLLTNAHSTSGFADVFVAKLTDAGTSSSFTWAQRAGGDYDDRAMALAVVGSTVYVAGLFASPTLAFGTTTLVNSSNNNSEVFVAKLTDAGASGRFTWAQKADTNGNTQLTGLTLNGMNLYLVGVAFPPAAFGNLTITRLPGQFVGDKVSFLASLTDTALLTTSAPTSAETVSIYPNPAHASTLVQLPEIVGAIQATLTLHDALGQEIRTTQVVSLAEDQPYELSLAGLASGMYVLHLQIGARTVVRRLTVN